MKLSDLKEFPILGARDQRELVDEETWKAWMRSKGAYVAKIARNSRFAVMFGEENYVNVCRDLFSLEMSQHMEGAGGLVTVPGMVDFDYMLHTVFLPEKYDAVVYWHEALHLALFACEVFGINPLEQEADLSARPDCQDMVYAREQYVADKKQQDGG
jgi:hypothetical protein